MLYPKIVLAQNIIDVCRANELENIIISPGSRNAPLTIGFANNPYFNCYSIVDERCAAFFALGIAQQTRQPVVLICTSGSALLNYYPAFAEAFYSQIPLIVISADRPIDKIDIGDGQTIRQQNVFDNHSLCNVNLTEHNTTQNIQEMSNAIGICKTQKGPIHINAPFEEPLYETIECFENQFNIIKKETFEVFNDSNNINFLANIWNQSHKKLILVGENFPDSIDENVTQLLAKKPSVVVMTESISNWHHPKFINNIDAIITPFVTTDFENLQPDILITFGGMVVSKRIKTFLRNYPPKHHWHIDAHRAYDTYNCLSQHIKSKPNVFFNQFLNITHNISSDYNDNFQLLKKNRQKKHFEYLSTIEFSDLKAYEIIAHKLLPNSMLQISNSAAIRYMQLFDIEPSITQFCNRGTSGIDGSTTTSIGAAVASARPTVLITGDISFFYDSNALWNNYIPRNYKIIIINNAGGGIFRILPGFEDNTVFNTFFETSHQLTAENLAKMYQFEYQKAITELELKTVLIDFFKAKSPSILEIFTPIKKNNEILKKYFDFIK